jgi:hypothetical protein
MDYFPNRHDAHRMMPGEQASPDCRAWCLICRISAGVNRRLRRSFDGISLVHEAAAISASAAYPSPAPIAAAITARTASAAGCAITDRLRRRTLLDRMQRGRYNDVWPQV